MGIECGLECLYVCAGCQDHNGSQGGVRNVEVTWQAGVYAQDTAVCMPQFKIGAESTGGG
jgi:hypothetical protein